MWKFIGNVSWSCAHSTTPLFLSYRNTIFKEVLLLSIVSTYIALWLSASTSTHRTRTTYEYAQRMCVCRRTAEWENFGAVCVGFCFRFASETPGFFLILVSFVLFACLFIFPLFVLFDRFRLHSIHSHLFIQFYSFAFAHTSCMSHTPANGVVSGCRFSRMSEWIISEPNAECRHFAEIFCEMCFMSLFVSVGFFFVSRIIKKNNEKKTTDPSSLTNSLFARRMLTDGLKYRIKDRLKQEKANRKVNFYWKYIRIKWKLNCFTGDIIARNYENFPQQFFFTSFTGSPQKLNMLTLSPCVRWFAFTRFTQI